MSAHGLRAIGLLAVLAAGCGDAVGTGGQRLRLPAVRPLDFGAVVERTTKSVEVVVENPLEESIELLPPEDVAPFGAALFGTVTLAARERLPITLFFAPGEPGPASRELVVKSRVGTVARFALSGEGVADLGLRCDEAVAFGPEPQGGAEVQQRFRCENLSAGETRILVGDVSGDDRVEFRVDLPGGPLHEVPAGGTLEVPVWFRPRAYGSESFAWVEILREDEARRARVKLYGSTADSCFFAAPPPEGLDFGCHSPGESETRRVTLRNGCAFGVEVMRLALEGGAAGSFRVAPDAGPLWVSAAVDGVPGEAPIDVTFAPRPTDGPEVGTALVVTPGSPELPPSELALSGCVR